jgi:DNA-binding GntR family transcriptional regulator
VRRIARLDGEPVALLTAAFPAALAKVLPRRVVADGPVLPALVQHGSRPSRVDLRLEVTFASGADSGLLEVTEGAPLMMIRSRLCAGSGGLVAVTRQLYRSDRFQFAYAADLGADGWAIGGH